MRPVDVEALRRLRDRGPLTIPEAYDCGHETRNSDGHGMHRLTSAGYVVFFDWDPAHDDVRWRLTKRGTEALESAESTESAGTGTA